MKTVLVPTSQVAEKILGKSVRVAHASKCGTCSCKCACRYNIETTGKRPW